MRRLIYILMAIAAAGSLIGCGGRGASRAMDLADSLMETDPERSLALLDSLDKADSTGQILTSDALLARHALLSSQARYKCYIYDTDDSVISTAVDYYQRHGSDFDRMRAHFYDGVIKYNMGDTEGSMLTLFKAYDIARELGDPLWIARTAEMLADNFGSLRSYSAEIPLRRIASENYKKVGRLVNYMYPLIDIVGAYTNNGQYDSACIVSDRMITELSDTSTFNAEVRLWAYKTIIRVYSIKDRNEEASQLFDTISRYSAQVPLSAFDYVNAAYIAKDKGNKPLMKEYLDSAETRLSHFDETLEYLQALNNYEGFGKKPSKSDELNDTILNRLLTIVHQMSSSKIAQILGEYEQAKSEQQAALHQKSTKTFAIAIAILISIIILLIIAIRQIRIRKQNIIEAKIAEIELLTMQSEEQSKSAEDSSPDSSQIENIKNYITESLSTINLLCNDFYHELDSDAQTGANQISTTIQQEVDKIRSGELLNQIVKLVDDQNEGVLGELRTATKLKEHDIRFIALYFAGFNPSAICVLLDYSLNYYHKKLRRIKAAINASDYLYKEKLIAKIS